PEPRGPLIGMRPWTWTAAGLRVLQALASAGAAGLARRGLARRRPGGRPGEPGHNRVNPCTYRAPAWHVGVAAGRKRNVRWHTATRGSGVRTRGGLVVVHNFSYGPLNPGLAYLTSCLGCFLGLQCAARARAMHGAQRARWLLLAGISIGTTGIWVMHFIAMLGFTIPGQTITYSVPVTILSMLIAVAVVSVGLLIVGFGGGGVRPPLRGRAV